MLCAYEKRYYALHALYGDLNDFERQDDLIKVGTYKPGLADTFTKFGYDKLVQECINELGLNVRIELVQKKVIKTKEQIIKERLIAIFGKQIIFE